MNGLPKSIDELIARICDGENFPQDLSDDGNWGIRLRTYQHRKTRHSPRVHVTFAAN